MKPLTHCLLLFITLLCLAASCNDDEMPPPPEPIDPDGLPLPTQTGENTFGCLINGEPWIAEIGLDVISASLRKLDMNYDETNFGEYYSNKWILRSALVKEDTYDNFIIKAKKFTKPDSIDVQSNDLEILFLTNSYTYTSYRIDTLSDYNVVITELDTVDNICSGTFNFILVSDNTEDTLRVSKGRFDKKYNPE